ncbi:hypothetical protein MHBO_002081 [Bonamia ostreae]|uniref:CID domain-containing protein n=1 Tax=Bonamia ostreae TaxID=126728 RepID=A0ABV2AL81_9EUKA
MEFARKKAKSLKPKNFRDLSAQEKDQFQFILSKLDGSEESIKGAKKWVVSRGEACKDIAILILNKLKQIRPYDFQNKLFLLYLVNDILHSSLCHRLKIEVLDSMSLSLLHVLPEMLQMAFAKSGQSEKDKLYSLLTLWHNRLIFNGSTIDDLKLRMSSFDDSLVQKTEKEQINKMDSLDLSAGYFVYLARGQSKYTPMDARRLAVQSDFGLSKLEPDERVFAQLEKLEKVLGELDPTLKCSVLEYKRFFCSF